MRACRAVFPLLVVVSCHTVLAKSRLVIVLTVVAALTLTVLRMLGSGAGCAGTYTLYIVQPHGHPKPARQLV